MSQTPSIEVTSVRLGPPDLTNMKIRDLAALVYKDWKKVNYAAKPYLEAMMCINYITDRYHADTGIYIVSYFLGNAGTWKGETAKAIKAELKRRAGLK